MDPRPLARLAAIGCAAVWVGICPPAGATPGDTLDIALRWLARHPFLGPPRLAPVEGIGVVLAFDAWQAGRELPGGSAVRLFLDVSDPQPHPPIKHEFADNRVKREILLVTQTSPSAERPPVTALIAQIYGPAASAEYAAAEMVPLGPDDVPNGPTLASAGIGPLRFEYAAARKGGNLDFAEVGYRGLADPFAAATVEVRRIIVVVTRGSGPAPNPPPAPGVTAATSRF